MRLVTITSIVALVVSIAVLVFVLGLYAELEKSEPSAEIEPTTAPVVQPNPGLAYDYYKRGDVYWEAGERQLAISDYTMAIELGLPLWSANRYPQLGRGYHYRGSAYEKLGQTANAEADLAIGCKINEIHCHSHD